MDSPCFTGHRQKIEDQTKAFPDRFGDLRMRVTPSTPSPRGSLSTTSHFSSQAQTPIQGTEEQRPAGNRQGVDKDLGSRPTPWGRWLPQCLLVDSWGSLQSTLPGLLRASLYQAFAHSLSKCSLTHARCLTLG